MIKFYIFIISTIALSIYVDCFINKEITYVTLLDAFLLGGNLIILLTTIQDYYIEKCSQLKEN
jgi:hypothetical protein